MITQKEVDIDMTTAKPRPGGTVEEGIIVENINAGLRRLQTGKDSLGNPLSPGAIKATKRDIIQARKKLRKYDRHEA